MPLLKEGKLYSILYSKCPRCNMGDLYIDNRLYRLSKLTQMHKQCPCCGQKYERETGFFYGAMYISYALSVALVMPLVALLYFVFHMDVFTILPILLVEMIVLFPAVFRWSRNIWLNIFVPYDPEERQHVLASQHK